MTRGDLIDKIQKVRKVEDLSSSEHNESEAITDLLLDGRVCLEHFNLLSERIAMTDDPDQINDLLLAIGEEFRHLLYHIDDAKYFGYLRPDKS